MAVEWRLSPTNYPPLLVRPRRIHRIDGDASKVKGQIKHFTVVSHEGSHNQFSGFHPTQPILSLAISLMIRSFLPTSCHCFFLAVRYSQRGIAVMLPIETICSVSLQKKSNPIMSRTIASCDDHYWNAREIGPGSLQIVRNWVKFPNCSWSR